MPRPGLAVRELKPGLAAEVTGLDLTESLSEAQHDELGATLDDYLIVVLPDQNITRQQQVAFSERFGELALSALGRCSTLPNHDCVATTNRHSSGPAKMCVDVIAGPNGRILP